MPSKQPKGKKRVMKEFKITEISAVDSPAQEGARALIMKRMDGDDKGKQKKDEKLKKAWDNLFDVLTSEVSGHQHGVKVWYEHDDGLRIRVDYATGDGDDTQP